MKQPRIIAHLDMDAFFAAIEERDRPKFKGMPIVVGADPKDGLGRGIVSTANYEARKFGIHSAMPISTAWRLSQEAERKGAPKTVFLGGNYRKYSQVSSEIMDILKKYSNQIEQASVDEAYFDLSLSGGFEAAKEIAQKIKAEIEDKERLTASVGIGPNKLIAKIASDFQKPDGLTVVLLEDAEKFLEPLSVRKIPGIGPKTEEALYKLKIQFVKDLKNFKEEELEAAFGKWGKEIYRKIRGLDESLIVEDWEAKSVGEQETFEEDTSDTKFLLDRISAISREVFQRFQEEGFKNFKTVAITVRFADFSTKSRAHTLPSPARNAEVLQFEAVKLFMPFLDSRENKNKKKIRLLGVRVEKLA
jgi:DNA polymerase IV (DinB-like DNA polymerase)